MQMKLGNILLMPEVLEFISYILNVVLATGYYRKRRENIENYNSKLDILKQKIYSLNIDANQIWVMDNGHEKQMSSTRLNTEFYHLVSECQSLSKLYENFCYDVIAVYLDSFRKEATGTGQKSNDQRIEQINKASYKLTQMIDSSKVTANFKNCMNFLKKI